MPRAMGTRLTDAPDKQSEALWLPQLGGAAWTPQAHIQPPAASPEVLKPKRIGYPLSDAQILKILDNMPQGEKHNCWRFAI